ncbi:MAG: LytR C-terminal domain-containing protein [Motilibacteraceae bacterium]
MTMLTPRGSGALRRGRRRGRRVLTVLVVLVLLAAVAGTAWWFVLRQPSTSTTPAAAPTPTCTPVASPTASPTPTFLPATPLPPGKVDVRVLNATPRSGLAKTVGDEMASRGFHVVAIGNDTAKRAVTAPAEVRYGKAGAAAALTVAAQVPGSIPVLDKRSGASVDLVLGSAYTSLRPPAQASAAATPVRPVTATPTPSARPSGC